ncbi:MAG: TolC family protein [Rhodocyclales bacterium]|nr:TolC family protein [Rhodocyclales bacterium]
MKPLLVLLFFLPGLSFAGLSLSLDEAEALWRQNNREVRMAEIGVAAASADVTTAAQAPNPELSLNAASISPQEGFGAGRLKDKRMDSTLRMEQLIERGGKRDLRIKGAESRLAAVRYDFVDLSRQQQTLFRRAYYDLLLAQEKLRLANETSSLYETSLNSAQRRQKAGDLAPVDVSRMAVDKARADNDARQARSELEQAQQQLAYLIGREEEASSLLAVDSWPLPQTGELPLPDLSERPDLKAGNERLRAAEADRDLARALRTRDINVGVQMERNLQNAPTNSYGVGISMPIFVWHAHEGEITRAERDLDAASAQLAQKKAAVSGQLAVARSALLAARDRLQRLEGGLLAEAERVARAAELAYGKGAMGLMDLLDARRTVRQVRIEAAVARADYAKAWSDWQLQTEFGKNK